MKKKLAFIFGTRPEIIKVAPIIKEAIKSDKFVAVTINTGQHKELIDSMLNLFQITPDYDLQIMSQSSSLTDTFSKALNGISNVLHIEQPDYVVVQGDTTTTLAGALAAYYCGIEVIHIEAGLRTNDLLSPFPEEGNRQMISRIANLHFCATDSNAKSLINEGTLKQNIYVVGNTGLDSLKFISYNMKRETNLNGKNILLTLHRRESFGEGIQKILEAVSYISYFNGINILFPVHPNPNVRDAVEKYLHKNASIKLIEALDYKSFVQEMINADVILTDSGGIQEEAPFLGKPVVVLREKTERSETIGRSSFLVGFDRDEIINTTFSILHNPIGFQKDVTYGDGYASEKIISILDYDK